MRCSACGGDNPDGAKFCSGCGTSLAAVCARCGHANLAGGSFCNECGAAFAGATPSRPSSPAPERYTPRHLAEKILAGRDALAGERKHVTVLFADVVGSTELIRDRDPEDAQRLLDGAVQRMMRAVHRYEGTVSRLMGDGLMAMFGAPVAHEDHAVRACHAALAMLEAVRGYAEEVRQAHGAAVQIRVGLNSGEVIVRLISDDLHMDYTAMGQTVHLASRMEGLASAGTALLTPATLALVEGLVDVRPLGPTPVKGLEHPIDVYELVGTGAARTRLQAAAARGFTRFVGRGRELELIRAALDRAGDGRGQVVALVGEPGVGKSRLVYEVARAAGAADWLVLQSGAVAYGTATSYLPIVELLRSFCRIEPGDDAEAMRGRITGRVLGLDRALEPILTPLLALLDLPVDGPPAEGGLRGSPWAALDPPRRRRATLDAVKRLLLRQSQEQPLLLILEDLHWVDSETQALLDELVEGVQAARMLLLVNYRPEYAHEWGSKSVYTQVRIDPLEGGSADQLLQSQLGDDPSLEPLKRYLIERTGGNPLFLEESVRSLVETGMLAGRRGSYVLTRDVQGVTVPATVQVILAARVDRLDPDAKRLLQTAAVIGKDIPFDLLQAVAESSEGGLQSALARLEAAEFVYAVSLFPDPEYTFKHALTHEVAYGSLLQDRRKTLHARVVEAIDQLYLDRLDEQLERLAHHALHGEVWERAVSYARQAGLKAMAHSANREAVAYFEQALAALKHLPESRETLEQAVDLRLDLRLALVPLGQVRRVVERLREAETLATALGDQRRLGRTLAFMAFSLFLLGEHERAIETGERALAIGRALDDLSILAVATHYLAFPYRLQGDYRRAIDASEWVVAALQGQLVRERYGVGGYPAVASRAVLVGCLAELGEFAKGMEYGEEAVHLAEALDHPYTLGAVQLLLGFLCLRQGRPGAAISRLEQCLELFERWDLPQLVPEVRASLGAAYALDGRPDAGAPLLDQAAAQLDRTGVGVLTPYVTSLSEGYLLAGRIEDANRLADSALDTARRRGERGIQADALRLLGEIAARRDPPDGDEAEARYREALALAEELGMRPLEAHCHLGLGKLYRSMDRQDDARAELSTAIMMLRDMEMSFWLPEAQAELAATTPQPSAIE